MPQLFLPLFSNGVAHISDNLAYKKEGDQVFYFNGHLMPIFVHHKGDVQSFKMILAQFAVNGIASQAEINRAFGLPPITMKRAVKTYRMEGPKGFFIKKSPKRKPRVLTPPVIAEVQKLLDEQKTPREIAMQLNLKQNTIEQAIRADRLKKKSPLKDA